MREEELKQIVRKEELAKEESSLIGELRALTGNSTSRSARAPPVTTGSRAISNKSVFAVGDQVFIENLGLVNLGRRSTRYGTVTSVKADKNGSERVYISRIDQPETWRAPKNLRKLSVQESVEYNRLLRGAQL